MKKSNVRLQVKKLYSGGGVHIGIYEPDRDKLLLSIILDDDEIKRAEREKSLLYVCCYTEISEKLYELSKKAIRKIKRRRKKK